MPVKVVPLKVESAASTPLYAPVIVIFDFAVMLVGALVRLTVVPLTVTSAAIFSRVVEASVTVKRSL